MGEQIKNQLISLICANGRIDLVRCLKLTKQKKSDMSHLSESNWKDLNTQNPPFKLISDTQQANLSGSITEKR
ncbi:MAG: hypothetical protein IPJ13_23150 [Saprospiraceae bacterium]|nr:hypothetical protein [Saprospiraceae bacterium]